MFPDEKILEKLQSEDRDQIKKALNILDKVSDERIISVLGNFLKNAEDRYLRYDIIKKLQSTQTDSSYAIFKEALHDEYYLVNLGAIEGIANFHDQRSVDSLIQLLNHNNSEIRRKAIIKLLDDYEMVETEKIRKSLCDFDTYIRFQTTRILEKKGWKPESEIDQFLVLNAMKRWYKMREQKQESIAFLEKLLQNKDDGIRAMVVIALGQMYDTEVIKPLIKMLNDKDWKVRFFAVRGLLYYKSNESVKPIIERLSDENINVKKQAIINLGFIDEQESIPFLIDLLMDEKLEIRKLVAGSLNHKNWEPENIRDDILFSLALEKNIYNYEKREVINALMEIIKDEKMHKTPYIFKKFFWYQDEGATQFLIDMLQGKEGSILREIIETLGYTRDHRATEALLPYLTHKNPEIRIATAKAFGMINDKRAVPHLIEALYEDDNEVRYNALIALRYIGDERALEHYYPLLGNSDERIKKQAGLALDEAAGKEPSIYDIPRQWKLEQEERENRDLIQLQKIEKLRKKGKEGVPDLIKMMDEILYYDNRDRIIEILKKTDCKDYYFEIFEEYSRYKSGSYRVDMIELLAKVGKEKAIESLKLLLDDSHQDVRETAVKVLKKLRWSPTNVEEKLKFLAIEKKWKHMQKESPEIIEAIFKALSSEKGFIRFRGAKALQHVEENIDADRVKTFLNDESKNIATIILNILQNLNWTPQTFEDEVQISILENNLEKQIKLCKEHSNSFINFLLKGPNYFQQALILVLSNLDTEDTYEFLIKNFNSANPLVDKGFLEVIFSRDHPERLNSIFNCFLTSSEIGEDGYFFQEHIVKYFSCIDDERLIDVILDDIQDEIDIPHYFENFDEKYQRNTRILESIFRKLNLNLDGEHLYYICELLERKGYSKAKIFCKLIQEE
ncbi:MAG: HEAT repeat domain-containing protein [Candidatus Heimdallarchaeota archaeon]|nr:HEAT repeat domain-containing protein [Candidatus Heimdallarchaeota archaeon]MCK4770703.1 HEAT repeat domain-containing protein [Candidatus Heimdallarchaeota archaeon]